MDGVIWSVPEVGDNMVQILALQPNYHLPSIYLTIDVPIDKYRIEGDWSPESAENAFKLLLQQAPELDAVFVPNDQMAMAVLKVCGEKGVAVGEQAATNHFFCWSGVNVFELMHPAASGLTKIWDSNGINE